MFQVIEFYVQPSTGSAIKFHDAASARAEAERLGRRGPTMLFSVKGWPRYDLWDRPTLMGRYGG